MTPSPGRTSRRVLVGVLSIAAVLLPAAGIAYLGAVSYREDRGLVAAKLDEQFHAATGLAEALEAEIEHTLDVVATALGKDRPTAAILAALIDEHPLAAFSFRIGRDAALEFPAPEPLRPGSGGTDQFLSRAPRVCPERGFDSCIRAIRASRYRALKLDAARRRELGACAAEARPGQCKAKPRDTEAARRLYTTLARFEDTGPDALLGLARLALVAGDHQLAARQYGVLHTRFGGRLDDDGVSYRLLADLGTAEAADDPSGLMTVYRSVLARSYEAPSGMLERIADTARGRIEADALAPVDRDELFELDRKLAFLRRQARLAAALGPEIDELARTAGTQTRGRPAIATAGHTVIYRAAGDGSIIGVVVDTGMLERAVARVDTGLARLAPSIRAVVERPGDANRRSTRTRTLATTSFGAILPHLSLALINDRTMPDPLDEIIEARGQHHLAITGALVALLLIGLVATIRGAARERELARLKSDLVSTVSHELKTPLTSIRMFAEMLQEGVAGSDRSREARYHGIIVKESQRLGLLIANLLDYSQIERGNRRYSCRPENAAELARDAVATFQRFRDEPVELRLHVDAGDEPAEIAVEREVVVQALLNLMANAIKYGQQPIDVRITAGEHQVTLAVSDHGAGIPAGEHERIFREFYRAPAAYAAGVEGTGLGLALVKRHVEAQGGQVSVSSEPGRGATFSIVFARC